MPVDDVDTLIDATCLILQAAEECLVGNGLPLPENRYVTACDPDNTCCDTLAVQQGLITFQETEPRGKCFFRMNVVFNVLITRCVPAFTWDGHLPPLGDCATRLPGTVVGGANIVLRDRYVLARCLAQHVKEIALPGSICCQPLGLDIANPICGGGCAGTLFVLRATI